MSPEQFPKRLTRTVLTLFSLLYDDKLSERGIYSRPSHDLVEHWRLHEAERHFGHGIRRVSPFPVSARVSRLLIHALP